MSATRPASAIAGAVAAGAPLADVLDLVDEAIERAAADGDYEALAALAAELGTIAERGGEWSRLTIAAARARALTPAGLAPPPSEPDGSTRTEWERIAAAAEQARELAAQAPQTRPSEPALEAEPRVVYSGWWRRAAAFVLDWIIVGIGISLVAEASVPGILLALAPIAYFACFHAWSGGATLGKAMLGIAVRIADRRPVGIGRALARVLATWVLWATIVGGLVDAILAATGDRRQSLHDMIAGTIVVRTRLTTSVV